MTNTSYKLTNNDIDLLTRMLLDRRIIFNRYDCLCC